MKKTIKKQIEMLLRQAGCWVTDYEIQKMALNAGHKPETFARICRQMVEDGEILKEKRERLSYRWIKKFNIEDYNVY